MEGHAREVSKIKSKRKINTFMENQSQYSIIYTSNWDFMFSLK